MVRWVAFDDESAEAVVSRFKRGAAEIQPGDAVGSALKLGRPSLVLLPARNSGRVLMARFEPTILEETLPPETFEQTAVAVEIAPPVEEPTAASEPMATPEATATPEAVVAPEDLHPIAYETSGFLGLSDQPIYTAPDPPAKRKWWQKLTN